MDEYNRNDEIQNEKQPSDHVSNDHAEKQSGHKCCAHHHRDSCCGDHDEHREHLEHGCCCHDDHKEHGCCCHDGDEMSLKKIIAALAIFIVALTASNIPPVKRLASNTPLEFFGANVFSLIFLALYFVSYIIVGLPVLKSAVKNILRGKVFDEQFLMAIASVGALLLGEYPEAVAVMLFYQIGEYFQDYAVDKSKNSIKELMNLRPDTATVLRNSQEISVSPEEVAVGETIIVRPGERIPLDGIIRKGNSFVDTSAQTGESVPREVVEGDDVLAGFINMQGVIEITVKKIYSDSAVARILKLVEHAVQNKAGSERFITKFARFYTPAVCIAAVLISVIPPLVTHTSFTQWVARALVFLVVSCPCALVISVPLSFFGGIGACSRNGILVKGSNYLESLAKAKTAVFDKTGTLTKGTFAVSAIHPDKKLKLSEEELIALATHAEYFSIHPISKSLQQAHHCELCGHVELKNTKEISGQGLCVTIENQEILVGNLKLIESRNVEGFSPCPEHDSGTIIHVAVDNRYAGHIVISDEVKEESEQSVKALKKVGVKHICMLTGDRKETAEDIAAKLGIDKVYAELLPEDKVSILEKILAENKAKNETVMYIGDGINDAPVLARADVGVAMGKIGSDAAVEAADVVILNGDLLKLVQGIHTAKRTVRIVRQNIVFSLAVKFAVMIFGAIGLANMWAAVFGDVGVTFLAVLNALRLL
ncbi:heavy metal translocating P-type ATPase [Treponema parvum]|uniref:heavy metal translocating P-type ATPase n=1 Tax=Treponema parvum TaxID=138851 RepID=UPI001AEBB1F5|nr:heavy metal translocating P-type ATPase [Treponema parvum]QTQ15616.1 heavy metal translocating P-type ATPase [Treponema parvum]